MIALAPQNLCSGCAACRAVCPRKAIAMVADSEGFLYPQIDPSRCVSCGNCLASCPVLRQDEVRTPLSVYAAMANDTDLRLASSSGGVFSLLARNVLAKGGVVFGAAWDYESLSVKMVAARNEDELSALRGSKYVQADVGDVYRQVVHELKEGRPVLFSGTPCQVAALNRVVPSGAKERLLTVEVVCHAAPSPLAFRKYAEQRERAVGKKISRIFSRSKNCSWRRFAISVSFHDTDLAYLASVTDDPFLRGFLAELYNRPSCHACSVKDLRSGADLTIGDYWNVHQKFPDLDDDKGTSIVLVNTEKGAAAFDAIRSLCRVHESDYEDALRTNPPICRSSTPHLRRSQFFESVAKDSDFDGLVMRLLRPTLKSRIRHLAGRILRKLIRTWRDVNS